MRDTLLSANNILYTIRVISTDDSVYSLSHIVSHCCGISCNKTSKTSAAKWVDTSSLVATTLSQVPYLVVIATCLLRHWQHPHIVLNLSFRIKSFIQFSVTTGGISIPNMNGGMVCGCPTPIPSNSPHPITSILLLSLSIPIIITHSSLITYSNPS